MIYLCEHAINRPNGTIDSTVAHGVDLTFQFNEIYRFHFQDQLSKSSYQILKANLLAYSTHGVYYSNVYGCVGVCCAAMHVYIYVRTTKGTATENSIYVVLHNRPYKFRYFITRYSDKTKLEQ